MVNGRTWEQQTTELINQTEWEISERLKQRQKRFDEEGRRIESLQEYLKALKEAKSHHEKIHIPLDTPVGMLVIPPEIMSEKLETVLVYIAQQSNGFLVARRAISLLKALGRFKTPSNASAEVYSMIDRCGKFERVEAGVYRLITKLEEDQKDNKDYWRCPDGKLHKWRYTPRDNGNGIYMCENCPMQTDKATLKAKTDGGPEKQSALIP